MDRQEMFDKAARGVLKQGKPSMLPTGLCAYRMGDCRCNVGHLIPDDLYDPDMEAKRVRIVLTTWKPLAEFFGVSSSSVNDTDPDSFWWHFQRAHDVPAEDHKGDNEGFLDAYVEMMRIVAQKYDLDPSVLDQVAA